MSTDNSNVGPVADSPCGQKIVRVPFARPAIRQKRPCSVLFESFRPRRHRRHCSATSLYTSVVEEPRPEPWTVALEHERQTFEISRSLTDRTPKK